MSRVRRLRSALQINFAEPRVLAEDREAALEALKGRRLTCGDLVRELETEFARLLRAEFAVAVSSCWSGLFLMLKALGVKSGDEVLVPALTHVAPAQAVLACGAKVRFMDAGENGNVDLRRVELGKRTKAIIVVHFLGYPCDLSMLKSGCLHGVPVIEDCALALGEVDSLKGAAAVFSFYPTKHITAGEGGMVVVRDRSHFEWLLLARAFGAKGGKLYDVAQFGINARMTEVQAALLLSQLRRLGSILRVRRKNFLALMRLGVPCLFQGVTSYAYPAYAPGYRGWSRVEVINRLGYLGVEASIYYPYLPGFSLFKAKEDYPGAREISEKIICLPVGHHLGRKDMKEIAKAFGWALAKE